MKKLIYLAMMLTGLSAYASTDPDVNAKVLKAFHETFTNASNVIWSEVEDNGYKANFEMSQIQVRALYDTDGNLLETVRYYDERALPVNIVAGIKKQYPGKKIFGVTEISTDNDIAYHVTLRDEKNWYVVKSDPYANITLSKKFKDANQ